LSAVPPLTAQRIWFATTWAELYSRANALVITVVTTSPLPGCTYFHNLSICDRNGAVVETGINDAHGDYCGCPPPTPRSPATGLCRWDRSAATWSSCLPSKTRTTGARSSTSCRSNCTMRSAHTPVSTSSIPPTRLPVRHRRQRIQHRRREPGTSSPGKRSGFRGAFRPGPLPFLYCWKQARL